MGELNVEEDVEVTPVDNVVLQADALLIIAGDSLSLDHLYAAWGWDLVYWNQQGTAI